MKKFSSFAMLVVMIDMTKMNLNNNLIMNCDAFQITSPSSSSSLINNHYCPNLSLMPFSSSSSSLSLTTTTTTTTTTAPTLTSTSLFVNPDPTPFNSNSISIETNEEAKDPTTLISAKPSFQQQIAFAAISSGIIGGSVVFVNVYNYLETVLPSSIFTPFYTILPYVLSTAFIAAGISHFVLEDTFTSFVPPKGSWGGLWNVPSPFSEQLGLTYEQYHSFWTGIAEIVVGSSLIITTSGILGGGGDDLGSYHWNTDPTYPSALMYLLTLAVTPANIYMYTHNPVVPRIPVLPYPYGHVGRGLLQCALLAVFYKLTIHSYFDMSMYAWGVGMDG